MICVNSGECPYQNTTAPCVDMCKYIMSAPISTAVTHYPSGESVVQFTGPAKVTNQFAPNENLIVELKKLLAEAENGKLRSMAYALVRHDDLIKSGSTSTGYVLEDGTSFALGEVISRLRHRWDQDRDAD